MHEFRGFLIDDDLNFYNARTGNKVTPFIGRDGYEQVSRKTADNVLYHMRTHVAIANVFIPNPNHYKYINHIDSDKTNNSIENLEWCDNSYNVKHGWASGNRSHKNNTAIKAVNKVTGEEQTFKSIRELGRSLKIDRHKVARILKGELSNHYEYDFYYM